MELNYIGIVLFLQIASILSQETENAGSKLLSEQACKLRFFFFFSCHIVFVLFCIKFQ